MLFETYVIEVIQRTHDIMSIRFEKPQRFGYLVGQYVILILGDSPDQVKKPFTLSSSPTEGFLEITKKADRTSLLKCSGKPEPRR
jgi:ferredoxin-NADP reductase